MNAGSLVRPAQAKGRVSGVIPVYNEESTIRRLLDSFRGDGSVEIIIVDGGSTDGTVELAGSYPVKVIRSEKNRGIQMNRGAEAAEGEALLFLHADCLLEEGSLEAVAHSLGNGCIGGCLRQRIQSGRRVFRFIEGTGNLRARWLRVFYGDQAIFTRRSTFLDMGGFGSAPLFEDIVFSRELKKRGRTCMLDKQVHTSPRRWERQGILRTTLINYLLTAGFLLGLPADRLRRIYGDIR